MQPNSPDLDQQANGPVGLADADGIKKGLNGSAEFLAQFLVALQAMRGGDFSVRMAVDGTGIEGKIADIFNEIVTTNYRMAKELERVGQVVGREGKIKHRVTFGVPHGSWGEMEGSINTLIDDLLWPTTEVTRTVAAVARGDLQQTVRSRRRRSTSHGRVLTLGHDRQHHDQAARRVHLRSDARRSRGG